MSRKRSARIHIKVTPETKQGLRRAARRRGVSMSELIRAGAKRLAFDDLAGDEHEVAEESQEEAETGGDPSPQLENEADEERSEDE